MSVQAPQGAAARRDLPVVVVGCGRAGLLHAGGYGRGALAVYVDPRPGAEARAALPEDRCCASLQEGLLRAGPSAIVDLCVPADQTAQVARLAVGLGARRFMIEKPLAPSHADARSLAALLAGSEAAYLDTYASSRGVRELAGQIAGRRVRELRIRFAKDRRQDSGTSRGFFGDRAPSAWLIEGPHLASIALRLAGPVGRVHRAEAWGMELPDGRILPEHGGARAVLSHAGGTLTHLETDLACPGGQRCVEADLEDGARYRLTLPPSRAKALVSVLVEDTSKRRWELEDRPLDQCVREAMEAIARPSPERLSRSISHGLAVSQTLDQLMGTAQTHSALG